MSHFKEIKSLPIFDLYSEMIKMISNGNIHWGNDNQICLNSYLGKENDYFYGSGSLYYDWDNKTVIIENGIEKTIVNKFENPKEEKNFTALCNVFKNTLFEEVYAALSEKYMLGRVRLMKSKPKTCLSWHTDTSSRIHYPIKTQEGCFMVIDKEVQHLNKNTWWWTNTVLPHTAFNGSKEDRIHLVAVLLDSR